ncbi:putative phospholipid ABC transporter permease protein MlaE [Pigmentiphaga humi]|uniref:Putative phospholipid ABC transporter permease protein MlaE n=1 Tax=Pigmentiphaga humi TaxID=2478468 RepID=A0A3P4AZM7_9BURK|nr:ABC transporter permease [Pigmentiphaga humi]VCU69493.1 putative phospholipid ABC transporter permease protein MlaE [Pigmentiphaga humi]
MSDRPQPGRLVWETSPQDGRLAAEGDWTLAGFEALRREAAGVAAAEVATLDVSRIGALDTAGAALLVDLVGAERLPALIEAGPPLAPARRALLDTVIQAENQVQRAAPAAARRPGAEMLGRIGWAAEQMWRHAVDQCGFIGLTLERFVRGLVRPRSWRITATVAQIEQVGLDAVPIIALLTFLVGAVVAFLGATVLQEFGAAIYTVNLVGFAFLREFAVLLTAILMAGRTASAFTAQIGSMKANEEIDALRALGLNPIDMLVLPRVLAMMVSLPILTFMSMLTGIAGGMLVCAWSLEIPPSLFLSTLHESLGVRHFYVGMAKAPILAFVIAVIGCLEGFKVSGSAQSVGEHTTSSVVQSIFMVILIDALAALFCMEMGW